MIIMIILFVITLVAIIFPAIGHHMYEKYDKKLEALEYSNCERETITAKRNKWSWLDDFSFPTFDIKALLPIAIILAFFFSAAVPFMSAHVCAEAEYDKVEIKRAAIIADYEYCMKNHPHDTPDIYERIAEFDKQVYDWKYFRNNPWTNWYVNPYFDQVDYIMFDEEMRNRPLSE